MNEDKHCSTFQVWNESVNRPKNIKLWHKREDKPKILSIQKINLRNARRKIQNEKM